MGSKIEINTYFGHCTCCHQYAYLKPMWDKHEWNGETETYAELLLECFGLNTWYTEDENRDRICEECITRLRDACDFKAQVLKIQDKFQIESVEIKKEPTESKRKHTKNDDEDFELIEYLDENILNLKNGLEEQPPRRRQRRSHHDLYGDSSSERPTKWPRKLPPKERYLTYKQYSSDDFKACVEAIKSKEMTARDASDYFKIPYKTVTAKIRRGILDEEDPISPSVTREFVQDIKLILSHTNAMPFKSRQNQIMCAFCSTSCDVEQLRTHTLKAHPNRVTKVEAMLRPYYNNQMLKIDIQDLKCTICGINAISWSNLLNHLSSEHDLTLKQAKTNIIPFLLSDNINCAICNEHFSTFMLVDAHMNSHYKNYSCAECGETFITIPRLKNHEKVHVTGNYPCEFCSKVFLLNSYRKKHILTMHSENNYLYKCGHCPESFHTETLRQKHMIAAHIDQIKIINCELCGAMFYFNSVYKKHLRRKHNSENVCKVCGKAFENESLLKEHMLRHSKMKVFQCDICIRGYYSRSSLKMHLKRHENETIK